MKGKYRVLVETNRLKYEFILIRNITIIKGNSATGKSTLVNLIRDYEELGTDSGIELICEKACVVLEGRKWQRDLADIKDSIVFIDEGNKFIKSKEFAEQMKSSDNYYVLITREKLPMLPYSVKEIYGFRESKKYYGIKPVYHEFYGIYDNLAAKVPICPVQIITEDSNSGYQFF